MNGSPVSDFGHRREHLAVVPAMSCVQPIWRGTMRAIATGC